MSRQAAVAFGTFCPFFQIDLVATGRQRKIRDRPLVFCEDFMASI